MDSSLPGSTVHGIFQARTLEWAAISFSRGSSQPRDRTWVSCIANRRFTVWARKRGSNMFSNQPKVMHATDKWQSRHLCSNFFLFLQSYAFFFFFQCNIQLYWWCWHSDSEKIVLNKCENKSWAIHYPSFISKPSSLQQGWAALETFQCKHREKSVYIMVTLPARLEGWGVEEAISPKLSCFCCLIAQSCLILLWPPGL